MKITWLGEFGACHSAYAPYLHSESPTNELQQICRSAYFCNIPKQFFLRVRPHCIVTQRHCDKCKSTDNAGRHYFKVITIWGECFHDDVIKWKYFLRYWPFVWGIHRSPVNSPHKDQWRGTLMFTLICARINDWVNNREAGDLRRHRAHYDVIVMRNFCGSAVAVPSQGRCDWGITYGANGSCNVHHALSRLFKSLFAPCGQSVWVSREMLNLQCLWHISRTPFGTHNYWYDPCDIYFVKSMSCITLLRSSFYRAVF